MSSTLRCWGFGVERLTQDRDLIMLYSSHLTVSVIAFCCKTVVVLYLTGCQDRTGGVHQPAADGAQVVSAALPGALSQGVLHHFYSFIMFHRL